MAFIPPFPPRPKQDLPPLTLLRTARENLVAIWPEECFSLPFFGHKLLRRQIFVCNSPETVRQAFIDDPDNMDRKSPQQRHALKPLIGDGLFVSDGALWRERRKMVAPLTHISRLPALGPIITAAAADRLALWRARAGQQVDVLAHMAQLAADIICRVIFGAGTGIEVAETVVSAFTEYQALIGQMDLLSLIGLPDMIPRLHSPRVRRSAARIQTIIARLIAQGTHEASWVASLIAESGLTPHALRNEVAVLFMAGHETSANTMAWVWYLLSQDPETEARLHAEVDALGGRPATYADLPRLRFTRAVIEETLRLFPPVPIQARQNRARCTLGGREVPANSIVMLVPWLLHRNPELWSEPDSFTPDRFMPGGSGLPSRYAYVPFSIGPRICTGMAFALAETVICIATLAQHIRPRLAPGATVMPSARLSLRPGERLPMRLEPR